MAANRYLWKEQHTNPDFPVCVQHTKNIQKNMTTLRLIQISNKNNSPVFTAVLAAGSNS